MQELFDILQANGFYQCFVKAKAVSEYMKVVPVNCGCAVSFSVEVLLSKEGAFAGCRLWSTPFDARIGKQGKLAVMARWKTLKGAQQGVIPAYEKLKKEFTDRLAVHYKSI